MTVASETLARTPLYAEHVALGARIVPFAGFAMPVQYAGVLREHAVVRGAAGLFDLSHMAQFALEGSGVDDWADALTVNRVATMRPGQARYNLFCDDAGGVLDDVLFYRLDGDRRLLVVNAGNARAMAAYLRERAAGVPNVAVVDLRAERALIAVQGPRSAELLAPLCDADLGALRYYACTPARVAGTETLLARTGYTGEDGFECFVAADAAVGLWRALLAAGATPCGLGARDVLRLEAGMPLYGHELGPEVSPIAAELRWAVKFEKSFRGRDALLAEIDDPAKRRIVGIRMDGGVPARTGYPVYANAVEGEAIGEVRSGTFAPSVGGAQIATVLIERAHAAVGTPLFVEIRGARHAARVASLPFYRRGAQGEARP